MRLKLGFFKTLICFHIFFLFSTFSSVSGKVFSEKTILLEFKNSVSDPLGILSSWNANVSDHCSWYGVSCDSKSRVLELNITGGDCKRGNSKPISCSTLPQFPFYGFGIRRTCSCSSVKLVGNLSPLIGKLSDLKVLSLPFNGFSGEIPIEIWGLENLQVLDLEGNLFTGNLPNQFDGLRKLRVLNLGFNRIKGKIPFSLLKCGGLQVLNLASNEVSGRVPGFLSSFVELRELYLSFNQLTGNVSSALGDICRNLEHLDLSGNFLIGGIPLSLGKCQRLKTLLLFSNKLDGIIPRELGQLRKLEVLDVSRNSLSGPLPVELGNCVELSVLVLSNLFDPLSIRKSTKGEAMSGFSSHANYDHNSFQVSIPIEITILPKMKVFWAPRATLQGKFPSNWGRCDSLEMVNLAENFLDGELTGVFGGCRNLHFLNLNSNRLTGELDEKLPVPCMTVFDVSGNLMSGSIPSFSYNICPHKYSFNADPIQSETLSFAYLLFFTYTSCSNTTLPFPDASCLIIHNFGGNNFTGPIPRLPVVIERLRRQADYAFLVGGNKLSGPFPGKFFEKCNGLNGLIANFSNNNISGQIPLDIGTRCRSLKVLDASENQISGSIPQSLGCLRRLSLLDLSGNALKGQIPVGLGQLKYLKYLSLSGNKLTGIIPSSFGLLRSLEVLALSSNSFSGEIPQSLVKLRNLTVLLLNNNKLSGEIPSGLADLTPLSTYNVSCNNLSGPLLLKNDVMNCSGVLGNPFLRSSRVLSVSVPYPNLEGENMSSQNLAASSSAGANGLTSIEIASVISASAIFSVLLALIILFFYSRRWTPNSRVQVSESREIVVFTDIGVPLTYENIVQATGYFNASNCIGFGGFGATYKAEINSRILVAVKKLSVGRFQGFKQFQAEIKALETMRHPNLVTLIGYHASETEMFLIYNYLPGGNLENFIHDRSEKSVDWKILHKIALHIAKALTYLHDQCRVLHRDVKPSNILLDNDLNAYLSDFGLSRLLGTSETHATTGVEGTFGYVAPEYALTCRVSEKSDVYSYGVVLLELISDKKALDPSFSSHGDGFNIVSWACLLLRHGQAKDVFKTGLWDSGPQDKLVDALHLAVRCTAESITNRPTMKQVAHRLNNKLQPPSS